MLLGKLGDSMKFKTLGAGVVVIGMGIILGIPSPARGAFLGQDITISIAANDQRAPCISYDSVNQRFLVVWEDYRSGTNFDIYGQLINAMGSLFGTNLTISTASNNQYDPSVAYSPANQRFLVVWEDYRSGTNFDIYGQLISTTGTLIGGNFTISTAPDDQWYPSVAYDSVNQRFLVAWEDNRSGTTWNIYGQLINTSVVSRKYLHIIFEFFPGWNPLWRST